MVKNLTDANRALRAEGDENLERLDFAPTEAVAYKRRMEPILKAAAKERQKEHGGTAPGRKKLNTGAKLAPVKAKSRDVIAAATRTGHESLRKAEAVVKAAEADPGRTSGVNEGARDSANPPATRRRRIPPAPRVAAAAGPNRLFRPAEPKPTADVGSGEPIATTDGPDRPAGRPNSRGSQRPRLGYCQMAVTYAPKPQFWG